MRRKEGRHPRYLRGDSAQRRERVRRSEEGGVRQTKGKEASLRCAKMCRRGVSESGR